MAVLKSKNPLNVVLAWTMGILVFIIVNIILQATLSCTDGNGCLRPWCKKEWLQEDLRNLISNSANCPNYNYNEY